MHKTLFVLIGGNGLYGVTDTLTGVSKRDYTIIGVEFGSDGAALSAWLVPASKDAKTEPRFTLKAGDVMAASFVGHWAEMAELLGVNQQKVIEAKAKARAFREWEHKKVPD